jgi:hypothetical protein
MDDVKYVIGVDDTDIVKTMLNHKKLMKEIAAVDKQYKFLDKEVNKGRLSHVDYAKAVQQVDQRMAKLNGVLAGGSKAINDHATRVVQAGNKMNKFGMISQQVGYQVGDFFVQVQSGQNAMVAFSQQATQLAGLIPGIGGAIVGIGLSAATFGYQMYQASQGVKDADEALKDLKDTLSSFDDISDSLEKALVSPIDNSNKALVSYLKNLKAAKAEETLKAVRDNLGPMIDPYIDAQAEIQARITAGERLGAPEDQLELERKKLAANKLISDSLALATRGPAEDLGNNLIKAMEALRTSGILTKDLEAGLNDLLETTGLRAQAEQQNLEIVKEELDKAKKKAELDEANFKNRTKLGQIENAATKALNDEIALLSMKKQFGEDSNAVRLLEAQIARETYEADKLREGLSPDIVDGLMRQYDVAARLKEEMRSSAEEAGNMMDFLNRLVAINQPIKTPKKPKGPKGPEDPTPKMLQEIERRKVLIGLTEEQAKRQELVYQTEDKLGKFREKYGNDFINNIVNQTMALDEQQRVLDEARAQQEEIAGVISSSFGDAFMSIVDGTSSVKDAFKNMASYVVKELFRIIVVQQMVNALAGAITGTGAAPTSTSIPPPPPRPFANGGALYGGNVIPFAKGGVIGSPMMFPMAGGNTGLMGEAGPEAIMPLKRGKGGKLGVVAENSGNVVINQSFNFSANGDESVKKIIAQAAPQIAQMTKTSIINDRRRGGSTKAAFG